MKANLAIASVASIVTSLVPAVAYACPSQCAHASSSSSQYLTALGMGILIGIGSVSLENMWRKPPGQRR